MKLFRFGPQGKEKPGVLIKDIKYDVSAFGQDYTEAFFANDGVNRLKQFIQSNPEKLGLLPGNIRLGPVVHKPGKLICIGLNYRDHARETNATIPSEPIIFFKATSAICGPNDDLVLPKNSRKTDWEVELAVVIGRHASYVSVEESESYIAGYVLHNDYSEREYQLERGGQWVKGKSCDTFAPLGPYLVTPDELGDINNLNMWLSVNGQTMQKSSTNHMIFKVPFLIHYLSQYMSLLPGDIITTGTPAGVGLGMQPQVYLKAGDIVELGIDGLGTSTQRVRNFSN
ncbi:MAG TPA: fumarylacetoacetate hydrolase family protein [Flavisolibacter sp.]|nr:fumarylacetoacetate hydrolase family protein [Flavisolibacter sp.]